MGKYQKMLKISAILTQVFINKLYTDIVTTDL